MIVPAYLPYCVLPGAIGAIAAILFGLRSALRNAGWTDDDRAATLRAATIIVIGWFILAIVLAWADAYRGTEDRIPTIQYGILVPVLIGGLLIWRSPRLARIIDPLPQHWLIGVQLYRVFGVIFLILYATGKLPGLFALPAGLGDVLVGVLAPVVAIAYRRGPRENTYLVSAWNLFGLADLVVAVTAGFLTSPRRSSYLLSIGRMSSLASFRWCLFRSSSCHSRYSSIWRRWQSSTGMPCATTTVAKRHALRRDPGLLALRGFQHLTLQSVLAEVPGPSRGSDVHFPEANSQLLQCGHNPSETPRTRLGLEKATAFCYPHRLVDFEIVHLSIA